MGAIAFRSGQRIFLDSNALIYWVEDVQPYSEILDPLLEAAERGEVSIVASALSLLEGLVGPLKRGDEETAGKFRKTIRRSRGVDSRPITYEVLERAASIRATTGLRTPDAIVVATCMLSACDTFVTNDARLKGIAGLSTVLLSELVES